MSKKLLKTCLIYLDIRKIQITITSRFDLYICQHVTTHFLGGGYRIKGNTSFLVEEQSNTDTIEIIMLALQKVGNNPSPIIPLLDTYSKSFLS